MRVENSPVLWQQNNSKASTEVLIIHKSSENGFNNEVWDDDLVLWQQIKCKSSNDVLMFWQNPGIGLNNEVCDLPSSLATEQMQTINWCPYSWQDPGIGLNNEVRKIPSSVMTPTALKPGVNVECPGWWPPPLQASMSGEFNPMAVCLTSTSLHPGWGSSTSSSWTWWRPPIVCTRTAFTILPFLAWQNKATKSYPRRHECHPVLQQRCKTPARFINIPEGHNWNSFCYDIWDMTNHEKVIQFPTFVNLSPT